MAKLEERDVFVVYNDWLAGSLRGVLRLGRARARVGAEIAMIEERVATFGYGKRVRLGVEAFLSAEDAIAAHEAKLAAEERDVAKRRKQFERLKRELARAKSR